MAAGTVAAEGSGWREFMRRHWGAFGIFVAACILAAAAAVYVFWWFTEGAQSSGMVPSSLALWTMGNLVTFILYSIFWELLLVGVPVLVGAVMAWVWWRRLPHDERKGYHLSRGSRRAGGSGGASLFFFVAFCVKVYIDGNWNVPISIWTVNYVVGSIITILVWVAVIFGIPAAIVAIWYIRRETKKPSPEAPSQP